ncbi:MAG: hypothetical protein V1720_03135 [bacterium]
MENTRTKPNSHEPSLIPKPLSLNLWKHHAGFVIHKIRNIRDRSERTFKWLMSVTQKIGTSRMDFYFGTLKPSDISAQILAFLDEKQIQSLEEYVAWLKENNTDYRTTELSDGSVWVMRVSDDPERYVHLHPAKNSPWATRVKANTLKTSILVLAIEKIHKRGQSSLSAINTMRRKYAKLSPMKELEKEKGLESFLQLLRLINSQTT